MKRLKLLFYLFVTFIVSILLYGLIALLLTFFPREISIDVQHKTEKIYLYYNEMHSDIILDFSTTRYHWQKLLPQIIRKERHGYLAFGWGDKETYISTPQWEEIPVSTAFKALFTNTPSLIHASFYSGIRLESPDVKTIYLTPLQYRALESSLIKAFGEIPQYLAPGYGSNDAFYHSDEIYNFIHTCNTWTGDRLREANITMSYWTPLSSNVIDSLEQ